MKKNREKKLPLYFPPPITSYLPYSVISAIVCANGNNLVGYIITLYSYTTTVLER